MRQFSYVNFLTYISIILSMDVIVSNLGLYINLKEESYNMVILGANRLIHEMPP